MGGSMTNIFLLAGLYEYHRRTVGIYIFSYFKIFRTGNYVHLPAIWSNTCGIVNILIRFCRSPTKFCLIIMMRDQLWFNSYMWRKEQDTQTNQQTHTHIIIIYAWNVLVTSIHWKVSKIFIHLGKMLYDCWNIYPGKSCNCDQSYYLIYDRSAIIRKFMRNQNLIIVDCQLSLWSM